MPGRPRRVGPALSRSRTAVRPGVGGEVEVGRCGRPEQRVAHRAADEVRARGRRRRTGRPARRHRRDRDQVRRRAVLGAGSDGCAGRSQRGSQARRHEVRRACRPRRGPACRALTSDPAATGWPRRTHRPHVRLPRSPGGRRAARGERAPAAQGRGDLRRRAGGGPHAARRPGRADRPAGPARPAAVVAAQGPRRGRRDRRGGRGPRGRGGDRHPRPGASRRWAPSTTGSSPRTAASTRRCTTTCCEALGGELSDDDVEVDEVAWVPLGELARGWRTRTSGGWSERAAELLADTA